MKRNNRTFELRQRIVNNLAVMRGKFEDRSTCPLYFNSWIFDWQGKPVYVCIQRYVRSRKRLQINYIKVEWAGQRMLLSNLFKLANYLTDMRSGKIA